MRNVAAVVSLLLFACQPGAKQSGDPDGTGSSGETGASGDETGASGTSGTLTAAEAAMFLAAQRPTAVIAAPATALKGSTVTLDGSASADPQGATLTYSWTQLAGTAVTLSAAHGTSTQLTAPSVVDELVFGLVVSDGVFESVLATATVLVTNRDPTVAGGPSLVRRGVTQITLGATAADPDGDSLALTWHQVSGPAVLLSDVHAVAPSFFAPDASGTLVFAVTVDDGEGGVATAQQAVRIVSREEMVARFERNPFLVELRQSSSLGFVYDASTKLLYASRGADVVTIDTVVPALADVIHSCPTASTVLDLARAGKYLIAALGSDGLAVIDPSLAAPACLVGTYVPVGKYYAKLAAANDAVYVTRDSQGMDIVSLANPAAPAFIGNDAVRATTAQVVGGRLYVSGGNGGGGAGLRVFDLAATTAPALLGTFTIVGSDGPLAVNGTRAYVATSGTSLTVLDVTNPASMSPLGTHVTSGSAGRFVARANRLFIERSDRNGVEVLDTTNPSAFVSLGLVAHGGGNLGGFDEGGGLLFLGSTGVTIADLADPLVTLPIVAERAITSVFPKSLVVSGNVLFAATSSGLRSFDAVTLAPIATYGNADLADVTVSGSRAFIAKHADGIEAVDVGSLPYTTAGTGATTHARGIAVNGGNVYVADDTGIRTYLFSSPTFSLQASSLGASGDDAYAIALDPAQSFAYVAGSFGLRIFDVAAITGPKLASAVIATQRSAGDVRAVDGTVYFANDVQLQRAYTTTPATPSVSPPLTMQCPYTGPRGLALTSQRLYVANLDAGLRVLRTDVWPEETLALYATSSRAGALAVSGPTAFVGVGEGLARIDVAEPTLTPISAPNAPMQTGSFGFAWSDHYPGSDERLTCFAFAGTCSVTNVNQAARTATLTWTTGPDYQDWVAIAVGNHDYFEMIHYRIGEN